MTDGGLGTNLSVCFKFRKKIKITVVLLVCAHVLFLPPVQDLLAGENFVERAAVDIKGNV